MTKLTIRNLWRELWVKTREFVREVMTDVKNLYQGRNLLEVNLVVDLRRVTLGLKTNIRYQSFYHKPLYTNITSIKHRSIG